MEHLWLPGSLLDITLMIPQEQSKTLSVVNTHTHTHTHNFQHTTNIILHVLSVAGTKSRTGQVSRPKHITFGDFTKYSIKKCERYHESKYTKTTHS